MRRQTLNGTWKMAESDATQGYEATVPGSVLSCLIEKQAIEDPYYRENEYTARDLFWKEFEFKRTFEVSEIMMKELCLDLVCHGIDTLADIYINGSFVASTNNMHRTWRFPIKNLLKVGINDIRILLKSTLQYIKDYEYAEKKEITFTNSGSIKGNQLIRKAHSMFGWDWGAQLPDAGIFRDIELQAYSEARILEVYFDQLHEKNKVELTLHTKFELLEKKDNLLRISVYEPDGAKLLASEHKIAMEDSVQKISIPNPELWWPNGFGEHPLYKVKLTLFHDNNEIDHCEYKIGLRTLTISQEKDQWGSEFAFQVNGIKIFTKGANYIPEDCIYSWITPDRIEYLIKSSVRANFNCLRVWGGGYYPSDTFYDLCDQYGLIVWQDLMFACNVYDVTEEFEDTIVKETIDNVTRIRHHACLGMWCGNNELESAWNHWGGFQVESDYLKADYIKQFEYILPKSVKRTDASTFYWPSSPSSGGCFDEPDCENRGDAHYWSVWHGLLPFSDYQNHFFRFCSEFGFQSFPSMKTVMAYTEERDRNIFSSVMESHQKNDAANGKILYYLSENFYYPKDFDSLLYVSQILQAVAIKSGVEHFRRNRGRCMGSLYWQLNDNWPVASWSSIDYFGRWKALHYMARNFYAPVAGSILRHGNRIEAFLQNESLNEVNITANLSLKTMDLKILDQKQFKVTVGSLKSVKIGERDYTQLLEKNKRDSVFVEIVITYEDGTTQVETETFRSYKHLRLPVADIKVSVEEANSSYIITLQSGVFANFVELDFEKADGIFSDNYFALTGEAKKIVLKKEDITNGTFANASEVAEQLKVRSIRDSYAF